MQRFHVFGGFYIAQKLDADPVGGGGGGFFELVQLAFVAAVFAGAAAVFVQDGFIGRDNQDTVDAVHDDGFALGNQFARVVQPDDGRDVQTPAQNRRMPGGAAGIGNEGGNALLFKQNRVGGRKVVCNQHGFVKQVVGDFQLVALPDQVVVDAADDLQHILFAFAQIGIVHIVELGGEFVALLLQCPLGVDFLFP